MRFRMGWLVAATAVLAVAACTSSGGGKITVQKTGGGWFQARPLVMPGRRAIAARSDSFGSLRVPSSEDAYNTLSPAQKAGLANALQGVDCAHPPTLSESADRVVCDADSDVFLLGPVLFTGDDVTHAKPFPPSASVAGWQVSISLTSAAAGKLSRWTSQHHVAAQSGAFNDVQLSSQPPCGPIKPAPCSDFTAYINDSVVVTVPVWFSAVGSPVVIDGEFNEAFATQLAHRLLS